MKCGMKVTYTLATYYPKKCVWNCEVRLVDNKATGLDLDVLSIFDLWSIVRLFLSVRNSSSRVKTFRTEVGAHWIGVYFDHVRVKMSELVWDYAH